MVRLPRQALVASCLCAAFLCCGVFLWGVADGPGLALAATVRGSASGPARSSSPAESLTRLTVEQAAAGKAVLLRGRDARQQLCVTGTCTSGQLRDLTRTVRYAVEPAGIVAIDASGLVTPLADGTARVRVKGPAGARTEFAVRVEECTKQIPINFKNQIVPIFTKLGCNSGGCHGKASGQNGFKLSLLGFVPEDDYEFLVKEGRGRRLFPRRPAKACCS